MFFSDGFRYFVVFTDVHNIYIYIYIYIYMVLSSCCKIQCVFYIPTFSSVCSVSVFP